MTSRKATKRISTLLFYGYIGLAFLFWENFVSSVLGIYHLEIRRTVWGVIYYSVLFAVFGGLAEILTLVGGRLIPGARWGGQKYVWLLTILLSILWGDLSRQILIQLFGIRSSLYSYVVNLIWLPFVGGLGLSANIILAKYERKGKPLDPIHLSAWFFAIALYLVISTKVSYRFFSAQILSTTNLVLQPLILFGVIALTWVTSKLSRILKSRQWVLIALPIFLTLFVLAFSTGRQYFGNKTHTPVQSTSHHPNIIIMLFDALRADHVGAISNKYNLTPHIDSLASHGMVYRDCHSTSSWTFPVLISLFTSRLPNKLGLLNPGVLPNEIPTMVDALKRNGYYACGFSANNYFSALPSLCQAFDEFHVLHAKGSKQLLLPFQSFFPNLSIFGELAYQFGFISTDFMLADWHDLNNQATDLLRKNQSKPVFLYLHYMDLHDPYRAGSFDNGIIDLIQLGWQLRLFTGKLRGNRLSLSDFNKSNKYAILGTQHKRYMDGVREADNAVANMMSLLQESGKEENTVILITSDHGEEFFDHGWFGHSSSLYEELIRVPLVIIIPPELEINMPNQPCGVSTLDIAQTVLGLAGTDNELAESDGFSLLDPYLTPARPLYSILEIRGVFWSSVVVDPYKLILRKHQADGEIDTLFFDLSSDPGETINLYPDKKPIVDSLSVYLQAQLTESPELGTSTLPELPLQEKERLRALGYTK